MSTGYQILGFWQINLCLKALEDKYWNFNGGLCIARLILLYAKKHLEKCKRLLKRLLGTLNIKIGALLGVEWNSNNP